MVRAPASSRGAMRAERRTKKTGSGVEFADHRDYAPGDDFRYLDWSVYQRFDRLLIRPLREEEDLSIYFIVDTSTSMGFGDGKKLKYAKTARGPRSPTSGLANLDRISIVTASERDHPVRMPTTRAGPHLPHLPIPPRREGRGHDRSRRGR